MLSFKISSSGEGRKSFTILTLPICSFVYLIFFFINFFSFSPVTCYYSTKNYFEFEENGTVYPSYAAWQSAKGREIKGVGFTEDPQLINPGIGGSIEDYKTKHGSIIKENGFTLDSLNQGLYDLFGASIPFGCRYDIGAYEDTSNTTILDLKTLIEGFYNSSTDTQIGDTIEVGLANPTSPYNVNYSKKAYVDDKGKGTFVLNHTAGTYYVALHHRNALETWSSNTVTFPLMCRVPYDFTNDSTKAYGDNLVRKGTKFCLFSGDIIKDGFVDASDLTEVYNDANNLISGYVVTDLNGDLFVDTADVILCYNNSGVIIITP